MRVNGGRAAVFAERIIGVWDPLWLGARLKLVDVRLELKDIVDGMSEHLELV